MRMSKTTLRVNGHNLRSLEFKNNDINNVLSIPLTTKSSLSKINLKKFKSKI